MKFNGFSPIFRNIILPVVMIILISSIAVQARQVTLTSGMLPYNAMSGDTISFSGTKISSSTNGINCGSSNNIVINMGNDTLVFGTSNSNSVYGINVSGTGSHDIKLLGGTILHGGTTASTAMCLRIGVTYDLYIENTDMIVYGANGHCIETPSPSGYNIEINGGDYWNNCDRYSSRCQYDGCAIRLRNTAPGYNNEPNFQYHYKVHGITIHTTPGQGIVFAGRDQGSGAALTYCYNINVTCDARNLQYPSYSGTCLSAANPYGIALLKGAPGSEIHDNIVRSGTNYGGGRGVLIENSMGSADKWIKVYNNDVEVHEGPNVEYGEGGTPIHALRVRAIDGNGLNYIHVYNNTFTGSGDSDLGTAHTGSSVMALRYSDDPATTTNILIEGNVFRGRALTNNVECKGVVFDYSNAGGLVFRNNRVESSGTIVKFGDNNDGAKNVTLINDTLSFLAPTHEPVTYYVGHLSNPWDCTNNKARDMVYENGAVYNDIGLANGGSLQLFLQRTLTVYVQGNNTEPVGGATVTVVNNYGRTVMSGATNSNGILSGVVNFYCIQNIGPDSTNYNNFTIKAIKSGDSSVTTYTVSPTGAATPLVTLQNTSGNPGEDITPPAKVIDLGLTNPLENSVTLNWTAPGDDGIIGDASEYDIRYSKALITEENWTSATQAAGVPSPATSGSSESYTVTGLEADTTYFFGLKAGDENSNWSPLSNVVVLERESSDNTPPAEIADLQATTGFNIGEIFLSWTASGDDGNIGTAAAYEIRYSTSPISAVNWNSATEINSPPIPRAAGTTMSHTFADLDPGTEYYVGIVVHDDMDNVSELSNISSAVAQYDLALETSEDSIGIISPRNDASLANPQPKLVVSNVDPGGEASYMFQIATDPSFTQVVASGVIGQQSGDRTIWQTPFALDEEIVYYWRVRTDQENYSPVYSFFVAPRAHVFPNPFDLNDGTFATFTELPENANLILMTVSGATIRKWSNIVGGEITWPGTTESGDRVASGTYLWFVEGTDMGGKIVVRR